MKRTGLLLARLVLAPLMLLLFAMPMAAQIDITNVVASVTSEPDTQDPEKLRVFVTVTYDLDGAEAPDGAVMTFDARLRHQNPERNQNLRPLDSELEGDFGGVLGNGGKQIRWDATASLERLNAEGKYDCTIDIAAEGQDGQPSLARININSYDPGVSWPYFNKGETRLSNLEEVDAAVICAQSDNWHETVEVGATFYRGTTASFPNYRGRRPSDVWTGPVDESHCSGFLAVKGLGTVNEKVWVNFAGEFEESGVLPNGMSRIANFVFQIRYNRVRAAETVNEFIKMGNAGSPGDATAFSETPAIAAYDVHVETGKADIESSDQFDLEVLKKVYRWYEGGALAMEVKAIGGGHFVEDGGVYTLTDGSGVTVNKKVELIGSTLKIDTTYVHGQTARPVLTFVGAIQADGLPVTGNLTAAPWTLGLTFNAFPGAGWRARLADAVLSSFGGISFFPTKFSFDGGANATAVRMDGRFQIHSAHFGCTSPFNPDPTTLDTYTGLFGSPVGIDVEGVEILDGALAFSRLKITKFGVKQVPGLCLDEFDYRYDRVKDSLGVSGKISFPLPIDQAVAGVGGGFSWYRGSLNGMRISATTSIPIEPPPLTLAGFQAGIDNLVTGPIKFDGTVTISHLSPAKMLEKGIEYIGPFRRLVTVFPTIFEVTGGIKVTWPHTWAQTGGIKIFGSAGLGIWLAEGTVSAAGMKPVDQLFFIEGGKLTFLSIAGTKPLMDGRFSGSISLNPASPSVNVQVTGALAVPNVVQNIPVLGDFGRGLGLPFDIASVELQVRNTQATFRVPSRTRGQGRTIVVDLTKLPSASAFSCPDCVLFSTSVAEQGDKKGASTLAADTTFHGATVPSDMGEIIFTLSGSPTLSSSVLVDPNGAVVTATLQDSSIVHEMRSDDGETPMTIWAVADPMPGLWQIGVIDEQPTDVVTAFGIERARTPFAFDVAVNDRMVTVTWDATGASDSSIVDFFVDADNVGYNGLSIGSVLESAGRFEYELNDDLSECSYYLHALRFDDGDYSKRYHADPIANPKSSSQAPTDVEMTVDGNNNVTLTWTPSVDTNVASYEVRLTDATGKDSVIAMVSSFFNLHQFATKGVEGVTLSVRSVAADGNVGCWSARVGVPISGVRENRQMRQRGAGLSVASRPNPARDQLLLSIDVPEAGPVVAELYDVTGRPVMQLLAGKLQGGVTEAVVSLRDLPNGSYVLFVRSAVDRIAVDHVVVQR